MPAGVSAEDSVEFVPTGRLTGRELEVLRLMADGRTTRAIAALLNIHFKTAACHRNHVLKKLGATSTVAAVRLAIRNGLVEP